MSKIVGIVPAKGTSDGLPGKNLRILGGEPLVTRAIRALLACPAIDEVYIDSEDDAIIEACDWVPGCKVLRRDASLATNATDGNELLLNAARQVEADVYVQLLCTAPFVTPDTISEAIRAVALGEPTDSALLTVRGSVYRWADGQPSYDINAIPNRGDMLGDRVETMGLYAIRKDALFSTKRRIGTAPAPITTSPTEAIDINTEADFGLAEHVAAGRQAVENRRLRALAGYLTSEVLADTLRTLGMDGVIAHLRPNIPSARVLGRARTLQLRCLEQGEDPSGIYDALTSYACVGDNDVIAVGINYLWGAYFGDLNARIARQRGASAAVIDGVTRDQRATAAMGFPVFSTGTTPADCKGHATIESFGRPINLAGQAVHPGDLIFADGGGLVVIPQNEEDRVLRYAVEAMANEHGLCRTLLDKTPQEAMGTHGNF